MSSVLVIKNADFSENALGVIDIKEDLTPSWMGKEFCLPQVGNAFNTEKTKRYLMVNKSRAVVLINSSDYYAKYQFAETTDHIPSQNQYSYLAVPLIAEKVNIKITNADYLIYMEANYQNETDICRADDWARSIVLDVAEVNNQRLFLSITIKRLDGTNVPSNLTLSDLGFSISFE